MYKRQDDFCAVRDAVSRNMDRILLQAKLVAVIDVLSSFALVAESNGYVKPAVDDSDVIDIKNGRHPIVEKFLTDSLFVPNDTYLDTDKNRFAIITGPNMAGKSTYMRQTAVIAVMAQIGSFVPASECRIGVVDKIFTRVGASDEDVYKRQVTHTPPITHDGIVARNVTNGPKNEIRIAIIAVVRIVTTDALPVIATQPTDSPYVVLGHPPKIAPPIEPTPSPRSVL